MLVDHVGFAFYPENIWLRVFGRMCVPIWFFLIGYAPNTRISTSLVIFAVLLVVLDVYISYPIFPLNILFSIIICRLILRFIERKDSVEGQLWAIGIFGIIFLIPTDILYEYGSLGLLFAVFGRLVRQKSENSLLFGVFAGFMFILWQAYRFKLDDVQTLVLICGISLSIFGLYSYKLLKFKENIASGPIKFISRYSLQVYSFHYGLFVYLAWKASGDIAFSPTWL